MRVVTLCVAMTLGAGCGDSSTSPGNSSSGSRPEKAAVIGVIDMQVLAQDYRTNQAAADEKYTDRRITVDASMKRIEKTDGGSYRMRFEYFIDGFTWAEGSVQAIFPASEAGSFTKLSYRSPVHISGRCDGLEKVAAGSIVVLRECRIVPTPKK